MQASQAFASNAACISAICWWLWRDHQHQGAQPKVLRFCDLPRERVRGEGADGDEWGHHQGQPGEGGVGEGEDQPKPEPEPAEVGLGEVMYCKLHCKC